MHMRKYIIFCHGWGTHSDFWQNLLPYFSKFNIICWNMGYFGSYEQILPPIEKLKNSTLIGVGHSLGFIQLLLSKLPFDFLISLQGFNNFLGNDEILFCQRRKELLALQRSFSQNYTQTLYTFYNNALLSKCIDLKKYKPNILRLKNDLKLLHNNFFIPVNTKILAIGSSKDKIVPMNLINDNFCTHKNIKIISYAHNGHNLGFYHCATIAKNIQNFCHT